MDIPSRIYRYEYLEIWSRTKLMNGSKFPGKLSYTGSPGGGSRLLINVNSLTPYDVWWQRL